MTKRSFSAMNLAVKMTAYRALRANPFYLYNLIIKAFITHGKTTAYCLCLQKSHLLLF